MRQDKVTNVLVSILIVLAAVIVYIQVQQSGVIDIKINSAISRIEVKNGADGKAGYTPLKGVDYFDGIDGKNATSTHTKETVTEKVIKEVPVKGDDGRDAWFDIRCNEKRNRWEVRFSIDDTWQILNGKETKCTIPSSAQSSIINGILE